MRATGEFIVTLGVAFPFDRSMRIRSRWIDIRRTCTDANDNASVAIVHFFFVSGDDGAVNYSVIASFSLYGKRLVRKNT